VTAAQEAPIFSVVAYLLASARDCLEGPIEYASLRMLEATRRLVETTREVGVVGDPFLLALGDRLAHAPREVMTDREGFVRWLDTLLVEVADESRRRHVGSQ
jgi:hypothetical protein